jgi:hypothetical protein
MTWSHVWTYDGYIYSWMRLHMQKKAWLSRGAFAVDFEVVGKLSLKHAGI